MKQLRFYFGDFDKEYIIEQMSEILNSLPFSIKIEFCFGDEVEPYNKFIVYFYRNKIGAKAIEKRVKLSQKDMFLFETFKGYGVLDRILKECKNIKKEIEKLNGK